MRDGTIFKDQKLKRNDGDRDSFNQFKETTIDTSLRFIQERFQGTHVCRLIHSVGSSNLNHYSKLPAGHRNLLPLHGEHEMQVLVDHFKVPLERNNFHLQHCLEEWICPKDGHWMGLIIVVEEINLYSMKPSLSRLQRLVLAEYKNHKSCKIKSMQTSSAAQYNFSLIVDLSLTFIGLWTLTYLFK